MEEGLSLGKRSTVRLTETKPDPCPFTAADPVALHLFHVLRPIKLIEPGQEPLSVGGDAQHPLTHRLADHLIAAALALAVYHLLIGQHRAQRRAPVDWHVSQVRQATVVELEEDPLRPAVVGWITGRDLPGPVVRKTQGLDLTAESGNVASGRHPRVSPGLNGVLLGWQAERVPAHGVEHGEPTHPFIPRQDVGGGVPLGVAHMQPSSAGVRKHVEDVVLRLGIIDLRSKGLVFQPEALPLGLDLLGLVARTASLASLYARAVVISLAHPTVPSSLPPWRCGRARH